MSELAKRTWVYICQPFVYGITCDKCNGSDITWSEFEHMIWCYACKVDTEGTEGVFDGPIPINMSHLLGMCFSRYNMETKQLEEEQCCKCD